ncbi:DeoR/GlpR family DNA-binding transcription regulator [Paenibacillus allorhizosphaerae]|uniref:Glucitol operon repressor n=1 Tax=Paenibacillus allorhizosphaerae TaxID=2849866 RepID=A0ABM8V9X7_9BACL|nr:DeoR/GlpR family DNA-binding transcription regulator [Paenibacillus allorhizosphaerae]CAG7614728.1 Glucitol operon repressor [Paenibacillus allorhizosphaerae]
MLAAERKIRIVEFVKEKRAASVALLSKHFGVHEVTIRRDLAEIEQEGLLRRTHGGVIVEHGASIEPPFVERSNNEVDQKRRIAKRAAEMIEDGDCIILDSGTTTVHIIPHILNRSNLTVVTNDINIAADLRSPDIKVIVTGGELYHEGFVLNGIYAEKMLGTMRLQKAFIGTWAIHPSYGLTYQDSLVVPTKQAMIRAAQQIVVLADDTKIGKVALHALASIHEIHTFITGVEAAEAESYLEQFRDNGIHVITA